MEKTTGKIYQQIPKIMGDISPISKDKKNTQQGYNFRGIDDVYNELSKVMAKHGVFTVPDVLEDWTEERVAKSGSAIIYRRLKIAFHFFADDGSFVTSKVIGEGMDSADKATNKAMAVAHKYALLQVFAIPTAEDKDPEHQSHEVKPKAGPNLATPQIKEKASIYTGSLDQKEKMLKIFEGQKIPEEVRDYIHQKMLGRPSTDLAAIIKEVREGGN